MMAAMTPGTAYGAKIANLKNFFPRATVESSSRANSSARPSMIGTCTMNSSSTRPIDAQNSLEEKTRWYWSNPPNTVVAAPKVPLRSVLKND